MTEAKILLNTELFVECRNAIILSYTLWQKIPKKHLTFDKNASICYCWQVEKNTLKLIVSLIFLVFISMPVFISSFLDFKQGEKDELPYQKLLKEELAKKEADRKQEEKIYLMGKFDPAQREDFVSIPLEYVTNGNKMYLRKETLDAFLKMQEVANKNDVNLKIASATRNFIYQKNIWNNKWTGATLVNGEDLSVSVPNGLERLKKILEYSSVPGTSRHHWGTDIDINDANPQYFEGEKGEKVYEWLIKNAWAFGFCQPYSQKGAKRPTGYNEEKWHWSYLPLAKTFTKEYKNLITNDDIKGFDGDKYVAEQDLINNYVLGINPECL
jgi:zinc D-Ala-D-Ala carboxypeptidase